MMVQQSGLDEYFEFLVSNEDVSRSKPDPEIYTTAIARMGVVPAETLIVEDAPHGLEAARRSGAHVCQVSGFADVDYFRVRAAIDRAERRAAASGTKRCRAGTAVRRMIQIVVPMGGEGRQFAERGYTFPKPLVEVAGQPLIEIVVKQPDAVRARTNSCSSAGRNTSRATRSATCLQLVAPGCRIVTMAKPTAGALCSVLLGMEYLEHEDELLVANADQWIDGSSGRLSVGGAGEPAGTARS